MVRALCALAASRGGWPALGRPGGGPAILAEAVDASMVRALCALAASRAPYPAISSHRGIDSAENSVPSDISTATMRPSPPMRIAST